MEELPKIDDNILPVSHQVKSQRKVDGRRLIQHSGRGKMTGGREPSRGNDPLQTMLGPHEGILKYASIHKGGGTLALANSTEASFSRTSSSIRETTHDLGTTVGNPSLKESGINLLLNLGIH
ncbi:hypothetical protein Cni_G13390 [Canna indica]|uniref:Uncharacterized protein n=1 Tax=Canna indica TaxID=4628 RepID=A0AAQ3K9F8_9LILI|nr:hypothetical protein Cni_G13390 [Canna indica]